MTVRREETNGVESVSGQLVRANPELEQQVHERTRQLAESEEKYRMLFEGSRDALTAGEPPLWRFTSGNPAAMELFRAKNLEELTQCDPWKLSPEKQPDGRRSAEKAQEMFELALRHGSHCFEWTHLRLDGEAFQASVLLSKIEVGGKVQIQGTIRDITEQLKTEETLRRAVQTAADANRAKSEFLANMSHEIRTPMNAIMGYTQLLQHNPSLTDTARQQVEIIHRSSENLLSLINSILEISKIEEGQVTVQPVRFDPLALLEDLVRLFRVQAVNNGLVLTFHKEAGLPRFLEADQGKIRQVLSNLLSNAIKFTEHGGIQLSASMMRPDAGHIRLVVQIEDTGAGIAPEEIPNLFKIFTQTNSGRQVATGSGLGLFISRRYARLMGGDITVASKPEKGSIFQFEVPVKVASDTTTPNKPAAGERLRIAPATGSKRVFVVDDMPTNREMLSHMLRDAGFEVKTFAGGKEVLAAFAAGQPDLILMDTMMPEMDGLETIRQLRALPGGAAPKIMTVSALVFVENREAAKQAGADDFLAKPFNIQELLEKTGRLLGIKYASVAAPPEPVAEPADTEWRHRPLKPENMAGLPTGLRQQMYEAVVVADFVAVQQIIAQVEPLDSQLASSLTHLADRFDAEQLLQLLEPATVPTVK